MVVRMNVVFPTGYRTYERIEDVVRLHTFKRELKRRGYCVVKEKWNEIHYSKTMLNSAGDCRVEVSIVAHKFDYRGDCFVSTVSDYRQVHCLSDSSKSFDMRSFGCDAVSFVNERLEFLEDDDWF